MPRFALIAALGLALAGCDPASVVREPECAGGPTSPLATDDVLDALRAEGFAVEPEERSGCEDGIEAVLTNNGDEANVRSNGVVFCRVAREPTWDDGLTVEARSRFFFGLGGDLADMYLANLYCGLYPHGDAQDEQVRRLERALRALEASLRG